ncbi:DUF1934 family protein [Erysipelothrix sp. HDW6A]|uniref:DUF1934 family protein n=1 Tax=Erysipelothrix sp. HDW6A TaxID=2714928 RepID=UPI001F1124B8|nr:DUF1934 family protein [Erysipelothrix sp. HDW6A]
MIITITQKNSDDTTTLTDSHGSILNVDPSYLRILYTEPEGASVVLDVYEDEVSMKRHDTWLTQSVFHKSERTELIVSNEHGIVKFDVDVVSMRREENLLYIKYHLSQNNQHVDELEFECIWEPEE